MEEIEVRSQTVLLHKTVRSQMYDVEFDSISVINLTSDSPESFRDNFRSDF